MAKESFAQRVKKFMRQGDSTKLNKFEKEVRRQIKNEIKDLENVIEKDKERLEEARENKSDVFLDIDLEKIGDPDDREQYATSYVIELLQYYPNNVEPLEKKVKKNQDKIDKLNAALDFLDTVQPKVESEEEEE